MTCFSRVCAASNASRAFLYAAAATAARFASTSTSTSASRRAFTSTIVARTQQLLLFFRRFFACFVGVDYLAGDAASVVYLPAVGPRPCTQRGVILRLICVDAAVGAAISRSGFLRRRGFLPTACADDA